MYHKRHQWYIYIRVASTYMCVNMYGDAVYRYSYTQMCGLAVVLLCLWDA